MSDALMNLITTGFLTTGFMILAFKTWNLEKRIGRVQDEMNKQLCALAPEKNTIYTTKGPDGTPIEISRKQYFDPCWQGPFGRPERETQQPK